MKLNNISKITKTEKKRLGLGHGSGRGKTAGRGTKGQKARGDIPLRFEGGAIALIKRMPFHRGKGKNKMFKKKPIIINVSVLNILDKGTVVNIKTLSMKNIINEREAKIYGVKILGDGDIKIPLTIELPISKSALKKIEKAGGRVKLD
ncbi:MAG: 50S ribosomal protein L15 [Patescibacteria group bacterium]